jgi:hypothetical protein
MAILGRTPVAADPSCQIEHPILVHGRDTRLCGFRDEEFNDWRSGTTEQYDRCAHLVTVGVANPFDQPVQVSGAWVRCLVHSNHPYFLRNKP